MSTFFKSHFSRRSTKAIYCRNYKNFDESKFIEDLIYTDFSLQSDDPNENYSFLTREFSKIVKKHAPLRKKFIIIIIYLFTVDKKMFYIALDKAN